MSDPWEQERVDRMQARIKALEAEVDRRGDAIKHMDRLLDAMLEHCGIGECSGCAKIICPFHEELHFHHDGCPACATAPEDHQNFRMINIIGSVIHAPNNPKPS